MYWELKNKKLASGDDISAIVVGLQVSAFLTSFSQLLGQPLDISTYPELYQTFRLKIEASKNGNAILTSSLACGCFQTGETDDYSFLSSPTCHSDEDDGHSHYTV